MRCVFVFIVFSMVGCGTLQPRTVKHTIEHESSVNSVTEELIDEYTIRPVRGKETAPIILLYDTTGIGSLPNLKLYAIWEIRVTDEEVEIVQDSTVTVYQAPSPGETLTIRNEADSTNTDNLSGVVSGRPKSETIDVVVPERRTFWQEVRLTLLWIGIVIAVAALGLGMYFIIQQKRARALIDGTAKVATHALRGLIDTMTSNKKKDSNDDT